MAANNAEEDDAVETEEELEGGYNRISGSRSDTRRQDQSGADRTDASAPTAKLTKALSAAALPAARGLAGTVTSEVDTDMLVVAVVVVVTESEVEEGERLFEEESKTTLPSRKLRSKEASMST